jgi:hypothetical protein
LLLSPSKPKEKSNLSANCDARFEEIKSQLDVFIFDKNFERKIQIFVDGPGVMQQTVLCRRSDDLEATL